MRSQLLAAVVWLITLATPATQERPNFSGRWIQESPKEGAGQEQLVKHDAASLSTEHASEGGGHRAVYKLDGTSSRNVFQSHGNEIVTVSQAAWKGDRLTIDEATTYPDGRRRLATQVWSLDAAGKLVIEFKESTDGKSTADVTIVFVKRQEAEPQRVARAFAVIVDDARYVPEEVESASRLLALLRDEVLTAKDLVSIVSTGRSSVEVGFRYLGDRRNLNEPIRKIVEGPPSMAVAPRGAAADAAQLRYDAHVMLLTTRDVVKQLALLDKWQKHLVLLSSGATSAAVLGAAFVRDDSVPAPAAQPRRIDAAALLNEVSELAAAAKRANVIVHTLDTRDPASVEALRRLK